MFEPESGDFRSPAACKQPYFLKFSKAVAQSILIPYLWTVPGSIYLIAIILGSISASFDTVKYEKRQMTVC